MFTLGNTNATSVEQNEKKKNYYKQGVICVEEHIWKHPPLDAFLVSSFFQWCKQLLITLWTQRQHIGTGMSNSRTQRANQNGRAEAVHLASRGFDCLRENQPWPTTAMLEGLPAVSPRWALRVPTTGSVCSDGLYLKWAFSCQPVWQERAEQSFMFREERVRKEKSEALQYMQKKKRKSVLTESLLKKVFLWIFTVITFRYVKKLILYIYNLPLKFISFKPGGSKLWPMAHSWHLSITQIFGKHFFTCQAEKKD